MGDVIEYNFKTRKKIQKYTVLKNICILCCHTVVYDSRKENNEPYIDVSGIKCQCICKNCAVSIKEVVNENKWDE